MIKCKGIEFSLDEVIRYELKPDTCSDVFNEVIDLQENYDNLDLEFNEMESAYEDKIWELKDKLKEKWNEKYFNKLWKKINW